MKRWMLIFWGVFFLIFFENPCLFGAELTKKQKVFIEELDNLWLNLGVDIKIEAERRDEKLWLICRHPSFGNRINLKKLENFMTKIANDSSCYGFEMACFYWYSSGGMTCFKGLKTKCK